MAAPAGRRVLVPLVLVTLAVRVPVLVALVGGGGRPTPPAVGECVRNEGDWRDQDLRVTQCGPVSAGFEVTRML